jgi:hypothetical protein
MPFRWLKPVWLVDGHHKKIDHRDDQEHLERFDVPLPASGKEFQREKARTENEGTDGFKEFGIEVEIIQERFPEKMVEREVFLIDSFLATTRAILIGCPECLFTVLAMHHNPISDKSRNKDSLRLKCNRERQSISFE